MTILKIYRVDCFDGPQQPTIITENCDEVLRKLKKPSIVDSISYSIVEVYDDDKLIKSFEIGT